jgi:hypothetical protein
VEGMHILAPPRGAGEQFQVPSRSSIVIDDLVADGAILEIASRDPAKPPLRFAFHEFTLGDVDGSGPASFKAKFSTPEPPGEISTEGNFGPWNDKDVGPTPVTGKYLFQQHRRVREISGYSLFFRTICRNARAHLDSGDD